MRSSRRRLERHHLRERCGASVCAPHHICKHQRSARCRCSRRGARRSGSARRSRLALMTATVLPAYSLSFLVQPASRRNPKAKRTTRRPSLVARASRHADALARANLRCFRAFFTLRTFVTLGPAYSLTTLGCRRPTRVPVGPVPGRHGLTSGVANAPVVTRAIGRGPRPGDAHLQGARHTD